MKISEYCLPVKIYLILALIGLISNIATYGFGVAILALAFDGLYLYFMQWACSSGYMTAAWILLLLPIIIIVFLVLILGVFVTGNMITAKSKKPKTTGNTVTGFSTIHGYSSYQ